ncbi:MAG: hypothetical protein AAGB31_13370 [Bdellovibrio sp.]
MKIAIALVCLILLLLAVPKFVHGVDAKAPNGGSHDAATIVEQHELRKDRQQDADCLPAQGKESHLRDLATLDPSAQRPQCPQGGSIKQQPEKKGNHLTK